VIEEYVSRPLAGHALPSELDELTSRELEVLRLVARSLSNAEITATGEKLEDAEREMRAAIAFHLAGLVEDGEPRPEPSGPGVYVERTTAAV
jgi:hypothetical protein